MQKLNLEQALRNATRDNIKQAQADVTRKRILSKLPFNQNMVRWVSMMAESAQANGLKLKLDEACINYGYSTTRLYLTVKDLQTMKDEALTTFIDGLLNVWGDPKIDELDYADPSSTTAYRAYTITWSDKADLGLGFKQDIEFEVQMTCYLCGMDDRKCHVEVVREYEETVKRIERKIVCD